MLLASALSTASVIISDPIAQLGATLSVGKVKKVSGANTLFDVRTSLDAPDGPTNFNGDLAKPWWADQAALDNTKYSNNSSSMLDFSRPGVRASDGFTFTAFCGGHTSSPAGGGIHSFNFHDACSAALSGGSGSWVQRQKSSRFLNASLGGTKPPYSPEPATSPSPYTTNVDGVNMFGVTHCNDSMIAFNGGYFSSGGASGGPPNGVGATGGGTVTGAVVTWDDVTWTPAVLQNSISSTWNGFGFYNGAGNLHGLVYDPDSDAVYAIFNQARVRRFYLLSGNWLTGTLTNVVAGGINGAVDNGLFGCCLVPDPNTPGGKLLFQLSSLTTGAWNAWTNITSLSNVYITSGGATSNWISGTLSPAPSTLFSPSLGDTQGIAWAPGPNGEVLCYPAAGDTIYAATPTTGSTWTFGVFITLTGRDSSADVPTAAYWSRLQPLTSYAGLYVIVDHNGDVFLARLA